MNNDIIKSLDNKNIKRISKLLKSSKSRRDEGLFVAEGLRIVKEALKRNITNDIYVSESFFKSNFDIIKEIEVNSKITVISDNIYKKLSETKTPQGILCLCNVRSITVDDIFANLKDDSLFLILDDLSDPGNLGTIIRSALGAGADAIILSKNSVDIHSPKVVRSTMGAIFDLPFIYVNDLCDTVQKLMDCEVSVFSTLLEDSYNYTKPDYSKKTAFIIGNEANGISEDIKKLPTIHITIPMKNNLESLNASVAASLVLYEALRQRSEL